MSLRINIRTIPHRRQRYSTCGDYWQNADTLRLKVSKMPEWRWEFLVAVHELIEWGLCKHAGVGLSNIDRFDIQFEKDREAHQWPKDLEPGDDPRAPYHSQHFLATSIERILAYALGVNWKAYEDYVESL